MANPTKPLKPGRSQKPKKLLDTAREIMRLKHYSIRTEETYIGWMRRYILYHKQRNLPVVLTKEDVKRVILAMPGQYQLMAKLLYGSGLRLMECLRLRVHDVVSKWRSAANLAVGSGTLLYNLQIYLSRE
jgi:integrase